MKALKYIEMLETGRREIPLKPLSMAYIDTEVDSFPTTPFNCDMIYSHRLVFGCNTRLNADQGSRAELLRHNERKVKAMFAEALYGDAVDELQKILLYSYEKYCDRELEDMIGDLIKRMRP